MNELLVAFSKHGPIGISLGVVIACGWYFLKELKSAHGDHREDLDKHRKEYKDTAHQMFDIVDKHTKATTELTQIIKERIPK